MDLSTEVAAGVPVVDADPFTREAIADGLAYAGRLREMGTFVYLQKYGVYATGQHKVTQAVLGNWKGFTSTVKAFGPRAFIPAILVAQDPPDHPRIRGPIMKLMGPAALNAYRPHFEREAAALVDRLLAVDGDIDGFDDIACGYVLKAFPDLLGLTKNERHKLMEYGDLAFNSVMTGNDIYRESLERSGHAVQWFDRQCQRDAITPDGLAEKIYQLGDSGEVTPDEAALLVRAVFSGGFDTTVMSISSGLLAFARHPDQWRLVRTAPEPMARAAFEETIRFDPPSRFIGRGAVEDIVVEGVELKAGARVACFLNASGRDPRRWEQPDLFDVQRKAAGHVSLGFGIHACLGQALARLEYTCLFAELARRVDRIQLTGEPRRVINNQANGWDRLPLRLHAA